LDGLFTAGPAAPSGQGLLRVASAFGMSDTVSTPGNLRATVCFNGVSKVLLSKEKRVRGGEATSKEVRDCQDLHSARVLVAQKGMVAQR
jgi:hypothetical protein